MFYDILYLFFFTFLIDFSFLIILYIFSYIRQIRNIFLAKNLFSLVNLLFYSLWFFSSILSILEKVKDSKEVFVFASDTLYSCYIAIFVGVITVFFTVFAFIKPKMMTFSNYQKYVLLKKFKVYYLSMLIIFFINTILIFVHIDNLFFRLAITNSIFLLIFALIHSIFELNCMENEEVASKLFVSDIFNAIKYNKRNSNKKQIDINSFSLNLFKAYILPCFEDNCFYVAFENSADILNNLLSDNKKRDKEQWYYDFSVSTIGIYKWYLNDYLRKPLSKEKKCEFINTTMNWIVKNNFYNILKNCKLKDEIEISNSLSISRSLYEIWFNFYRLLLITDINNISFPFILNGVEPLSFGIINFENNGTKISAEYISLYNYYLQESYQICMIALYNSNYLVFRRFLQDYINTVQYISIKENYIEILKVHNRYLLIITTCIANLLQEERISNEFKRLLPPILEEIKYIPIIYDFTFYDEPLTLTGVQTISKDFRYYFILVLLYSLSQIKKEQKKKDFIKNVFLKINSKTNPSVFETLYDTIQQMDDIESFNKTDITLIHDALKAKKEKNKEEEFKELEKEINNLSKDAISEIISKDIKTYKKHFEYCGLYPNEQCKPIPLPTGFAFVHSGKYLIGKTSYDISGIYTQLDFIEPYLYNAYIDEAEVKIIASIDELLNDNSNLKKLTLLCPIKYHMYLRTLENIQHESNAIVYKGVKISIELNRSNDEYIIVKDNLKNYLFMETIKINSLLCEQNLRKNKETATIDIQFPFVPKFYLKKDANMKVY